MVRDEDKKLKAIAKAIHLYCDDGKYYGRDDWQDIVVGAGLGIDRRTADSYFRLARIRRLIHEKTLWRWCRRQESERFLPKQKCEEISTDTNQEEDSDER